MKIVKRFNNPFHHLFHRRSFPVTSIAKNIKRSTTKIKSWQPFWQYYKNVRFYVVKVSFMIFFMMPCKVCKDLLNHFLSAYNFIVLNNGILFYSDLTNWDFINGDFSFNCFHQHIQIIIKGFTGHFHEPWQFFCWNGAQTRLSIQNPPMK